MTTRAGLDHVRELHGARDRRREARREQHLDARRALGAVRPGAARRPGRPRRTRIATGSSSARATGRAPTTRCSPRKGFFPETASTRFMEPAGPLGSHPDRTQVPGVEASTGSLGHGLALAVGFALALRARDSTEQRVVVPLGDAELNEGSNWESVLLAPYLGLTNLTLLVIDNHSSSIPMGPWTARLGSFGWDVRRRWTGTTMTRSTRSDATGRPARTPWSPTSRRANGDRHARPARADGDRPGRRGSERRGRARRDQRRSVRTGDRRARTG